MLQERMEDLAEVAFRLRAWFYGTRVGSWIGHGIIAGLIVVQYVVLGVRTPIEGGLLAAVDHFFLRELAQLIEKLASGHRLGEVDWPDKLGDLFIGPIWGGLVVAAAMTFLGLV